MRTQNSSNKRPKQPKKTTVPGNWVRKRVDISMRDQERALFTEYVEYLQNRRNLLFTNFLAGMVRGMGFAIGFSILGAIVLRIVQQLALSNLPGIGEFFAEVVRIVQMRLY